MAHEVVYPSGERITPDQLFGLAEQVISRGEFMLIGNDFDGTTDVQVEADPRNSRLHPVVARALMTFDSLGHQHGLISDRGGGQTARIFADAGVDNEKIIGTYGYERFLENKSHPERGIAIIDPRFSPYRVVIADALSHSQKALFSALDRNDTLTREIEVEIATPHGPIILERKGVNNDFPYGLAQIYHFRQVSPQARRGYMDILVDSYRKWLASQDTESAAKLKRLWGQTTYENPQMQQYGVMFEPRQKLGKAHGFIELYRAVQDNLTDSRQIGLFIYAGNSNSDAGAIHAAKRIASAANWSGNFSHPIEAVGIFINSGSSQPTIEQQANLHLNGVDAYAEVLNNLCDVAGNATLRRGHKQDLHPEVLL